MKPSEWCLVGAVAAVLVGILAPWAYGVYPDGTVATNTFSGTAYTDGRIAIAIWGVLAAATAVTIVKRWVAAAIIADIAAFLVAIIAIGDLADLGSRAAWGLWLLVAAAVSAAIAVVVVQRQVRREHAATTLARARAGVVPTSRSDEEIARTWKRP